LNLFNKYLLLVTFETNDNYSIRFEMTKHYLHSTTISYNLCDKMGSHGCKMSTGTSIIW